jgi:LL-diaminopimelate aminotransferase
MEVANRLNGIGEYYFSQKLREIEELNKQGKNIINLGIGSPDRPPHQDVIAELQQQSALPNVHAYQSYKGSPLLRQAIASWYNNWYQVDLNPESEVLPLIGSKEGIVHICMTFLNENDGVLVPNPGYPTYSSAVKLAGATVVEYELKNENGWFPDFEKLQKAVAKNSNIKMMFVNYPHMPTGRLPTAELFQHIVDFGRRNNILIVHDNPYSFILNEKPMSIMKAEGAKDVAIELNSLSKSHNMAGWRVGMLIGAREKVDQVLRFKSNMDSGMFLPLQLAAAKALTLGKDWFDEVNKIYKERRAKVYKLLDALYCIYDKQQAGLFVWAAVPASYADGYTLSDAVLHASGVFITPGGIFGSAGQQYVRLSLCASTERIEEAIQRVSAKFGSPNKEKNSEQSIYKSGINKGI